MYVRQLPNAEKAARQRWGVAGAYFPETTSFDGPTVLPDDVALEFQDVLLGRKPVTAMFSGGFTDIHAPIVGQADSKLIVSGGGTTTVMGNVEFKSDSELRISSSSNATFFDHGQPESEISDYRKTR